MVETFGIFVPQMVMGSLALVACVYYRQKIFELDDLPKSYWQVSDSVIMANQKLASKNK